MDRSIVKAIYPRFGKRTQKQESSISKSTGMAELSIVSTVRRLFIEIVIQEPS